MEARVDNQEQKHQHRPRYKGTHHKAFKDKYKELQPELYATDVDPIELPRTKERLELRLWPGNFNSETNKFFQYRSNYF
ncbi:hypothetical protein BET01_18895 [Lacrimispora algidixylanolytica]|uniref:Uncharacterized protein n=1 Tax=Lacrimispora algidixylanolytica TaxID=94868 RepID=A0A419T322_9FIRM|nr:hypothetical protein BET01_18895 [Lacrimispora algidixylanolytica]